MEPESNHTSTSSGMRRISPPQAQGSTTSSMYGLCRSSGSGSLAPSRRSSSTLPTERFASHVWQTQMGIGVPQYRSREMAQSLFSSSQLPNRPSPVSGGYQLIFLFPSIISAAYCVVRIYQDFLA